MKLKFEIQEFQNIAVNSIVDIFKGVEVKKNEFTIDKSKEIKPSLDIQTLGYGNNFNLDYALLMSNIRNIQMNNRICLSKHLSSDLNFTIEMETGTGKTLIGETMGRIYGSAPGKPDGQHPSRRGTRCGGPRRTGGGPAGCRRPRGCAGERRPGPSPQR
jgi:hypothetical protein